MNKFLKGILILSGCILGAGILFTIAALIMGATVHDMDYADRFRISQFLSKGFHINLEQDDDSILPKLDVDFETGTDEVKVSSHLDQISSYKNVREIDLDIGASTVEIVYGDVENVEVHYNDAVGMDMEMDDGSLEIDCEASGDVRILIPEGELIDSIDLDMGTGRVCISSVSFKSLDADIGAGDLIVSVPDKKEAYNYSIDCGLGEVRIGDETYAGISSTEKHQGGSKYIDIDCGAGRVDIQFA